MGKKSPIISITKIFKVDELNLKFDDIEKIISKEIFPIVNLIETTKGNEQHFLINYFFIKFVTIIETFCRSKVVRLIDDENLDVTHLFQKGESLISIDNLEDIKKKEFTKGRIIATNFNFQNPSDINYVFSKLLGLNLFDVINDHKNLEAIKKVKFEKLVDYSIKNWDSFLQVFEIRNQIVHSLKPIDFEKYSAKYFDGLSMDLPIFLYILHSTIAWVLFIKHGKTPEKDQINIFNFYKNKLN